MLAIFGFRFVAIAGEFQETSSSLSAGFAEFLALRFIGERNHRSGGFQEINPGGVPLPGAAGVEALLAIALECVARNRHGRILESFAFRSQSQDNLIQAMA